MPSWPCTSCLLYSNNYFWTSCFIANILSVLWMKSDLVSWLMVHLRRIGRISRLMVTRWSVVNWWLWCGSNQVKYFSVKKIIKTTDMALHMIVVQPVAVLVPVLAIFQLSIVTHGLWCGSRGILYEIVESRFHHLQNFLPVLPIRRRLQMQLLVILLQRNRVSMNLKDIRLTI